MADSHSVNNQLSRHTSIFGLRLWVVLGVCVGAAIVLLLVLISLWFIYRRSNKNKALESSSKSNHTIVPVVSKEIQEIRPPIQPDPTPEPHQNQAVSKQREDDNKIHIEIGKDHRISYPERGGWTGSGSGSGSGDQGLLMSSGPEVSHLGWGHWYTLRELEVSTNGFADENVIGQGGYGIVYRGVLEDKSMVAIKNLLNNRGQAEKEFKVEVEAIGRVRHKNLVRLLGYCVEGAHRMLVYEYVDNGNLEQWIHGGGLGFKSPLTWEIRMNIVLGTAKGLMYLHEGRSPVDYSRAPGEVNLVEWLKRMVTNRDAEGVLDPRMVDKPSLRSLKRTLLVALRCVDPNAQKRPKMGHIIHMLEAEDLISKDDRRNSGGGGGGGIEQGRSPRRKTNVNESEDESGDSVLINNDQLALEKKESQ
ncbi:unnamed protein product [Arabidopsis arenosa]|uniref:non-specific serine/threonine protein kinase n=1 Tax=Arabidopsis arenosa TaxID=38785 RepID=A0A8S2AS17_ARAAE|nr:unnamed protein product [Arabidopsis arenosa]